MVARARQRTVHTNGGCRFIFEESDTNLMPRVKSYIKFNLQNMGLDGCTN